MKSLIDSSDLIDDAAALGRRAATHGYLFFRGLLPVEEVLELRHRILPDLAALRWIHARGEAYDNAEAVLENFFDDTDPRVAEMVCRHGVLGSTLELQHHPRLLCVLEKLYGEEVLALPRILFRYNFPRRIEHTTPQHQDFPHVQGNEQVFTAWIPLGECTDDMGGLQVAAGSQTLGVLPVHPAMGAGGMAVPGEFAATWHGGEMSAGDVLLFNCLTVHRGRPNVSDRMRLSVDFRYQPRSAPISEEWLHPHRRQLDWETLYSRLDDDSYKYYWRKVELNVVPHDPSFYESRDRMALEMAAAGDRRAEATLHRIIQRNVEPELRRDALEALRKLDAYES